jgi:hypothetical protein
MAKQKGVHKYKGLMDGMVHYTTKYGDLARKKGEIPKERWETAPEFEAMRNSRSALSYASPIGKLIRRGVREITLNKEPGDTNTRLSTAIREVMKLDTAALPGNKRILPEHAHKLRGFEWNEAAKVANTIMGKYRVDIDGEAGLVSFRMPGLVVAEALKQFDGATHIELVLGVTAADFDGDRQVSSSDVSGPLVMADRRPVEVLLECNIPQEVGNVIVIGLGIQTFQEVNGELYKMRAGSGYMVLEVMV